MNERISSFEKPTEGLSFEEQFKEFEEIRLPGGTAEVGDFTPENLEDKVPVFLAPAWGCELPVYKPALKELFTGAKDAEGNSITHARRVISMSHPRIGGAMASSMNVKELSALYPDAELRKALNLLEVLEEKNIEQVDVIAHSEGAMYIAIAAMMYPEKFRGVSFYGPAGMMDEETWPRLIKGFLSQNPHPESFKGTPASEGHDEVPEVPITEAEREVVKIFRERFWKYLTKNPGRSVAEVSAIRYGHDLTRKILPYLHDLGIKFAVINGKSDPVFPPKEMAQAIDLNVIDRVVSVRGGHGLAEHPEFGIREAEIALEEMAQEPRTSAQEAAIQARTYHAGVRYIPGEGLKIADYIKNPRPDERA